MLRLLSFLALLLPVVHAAEPAPLFLQGQRVLFQGDSITDGNRGRSEDPNHILGHGYAFIVAAKEGAAHPEQQLVFMNRGVSGNTSGEILARWQKDALDLKPDVVSILAGINDVGRSLRANQPVDLAAYEKNVEQMITDTLKANPKVRLVLCEPFALPHPRLMPMEDRVKAVTEMRAILEKLAARYKCPVVHFQKTFDDAAKRTPDPVYWIWDGVHPTYSGHQLMADEWMKTYRAYYGDR